MLRLSQHLSAMRRDSPSLTERNQRGAPTQAKALRAANVNA
jgi:hypothetical protein